VEPTEASNRKTTTIEVGAMQSDIWKDNLEFAGRWIDDPLTQYRVEPFNQRNNQRLWRDIDLNDR